jgi:Tfp pilus assembly protein PilO
MKKLPENTNLIIKAVLPLIVIIILFAVLSNLAYAKITDIRNKISTAQQEQTVLKQKLELLRNISISGADNSNTATLALPSESPALSAVLQIKNLAAGLGLIVTGLDASPTSGSSDVNTVNINFSLTGGIQGIETFLSSISGLAPIMTINKLKVTGSNDVYTGTIAIDSYWSALPTTLPQSIEEFQDLTNEDNNILSRITGLTTPQITSLPAPQTESKSNPFGK